MRQLAAYHLQWLRSQGGRSDEDQPYDDGAEQDAERDREPSSVRNVAGIVARTANMSDGTKPAEAITPPAAASPTSAPHPGIAPAGLCLDLGHQESVVVDAEHGLSPSAAAAGGPAGPISRCQTLAFKMGRGPAGCRRPLGQGLGVPIGRANVQDYDHALPRVPGYVAVGAPGGRG